MRQTKQFWVDVCPSWKQPSPKQWSPAAHWGGRFASAVPRAPSAAAPPPPPVVAMVVLELSADIEDILGSRRPMRRRRRFVYLLFYVSVAMYSSSIRATNLPGSPTKCRGERLSHARPAERRISPPGKKSPRAVESGFDSPASKFIEHGDKTRLVHRYLHIPICKNGTK